MQAMVLAAGLGERMRPLTVGRAKPSLPFMNRPLILHLLEHLARHGVRRVVVNTHHGPDSIRELVEERRPPGLSVEISHEPEIQGTAGGLVAALSRFDPEAPILVVNADSLSDADLGALGETHHRAQRDWSAPATLAVRERGGEEPYAPIHLDGEERVCGIGSSGSTGEAVTFMGLQILSAESIERIPRGRPSDTVRDLHMPLLAEGVLLAAYRHRGWWVEIGTPALYLDAHIRLLQEAAFMDRLSCDAGELGSSPGPAFVGAGCVGCRRAALNNAVLGPGCVLGEEAAIDGALLGRGVTVGAGARVERCIVWDGAEVPAGASLRSRLVVSQKGAAGSTRSLPLS